MIINLIQQATQILRDGGLVAFPTETVYGLGADASNAAAVKAIFAAKERPSHHPVIVHISHIEQLSDWAREVTPDALKLAHAFWPGPLTLILKKQPHVLNEVTGHQDTVGIRIPRHPIAQALLQSFGGGVAGPSANKFTHISPTTAAAVREELGDKVDLILDGGHCEVGLESTIIDMSGSTPVILRPGMITADNIAAVISAPLQAALSSRSPRTPGMHALHYAPTTQTLVLETKEIRPFLQSLSSQEQSIALLTHSPLALPPSSIIHHVAMPTDAMLYAHDLYHTLRLLDHLQFKCIVIEAVPLDGAWDAIRDRITKASGNRG